MMALVNGAAASLEGMLGVSSSVAQVFAWLAVLSLAYMAYQVIMMAMGGLGKGKGTRGNALLLIGQCGAGKTALFFQLRDNQKVVTVSSLKPLRDKFPIKASDDEEPIGPIDVVDCPGHLRMRGVTTNLIKDARCMVYMIDAENKKSLQDVAEHLYELFTHPLMGDLQIPILLACNKSDLSGARSDKEIVETLEREIEQMRTSRGATLQGEDQADSYLGVDGEKFKLLEHSPCPIQVKKVSVMSSQLEPVYDFIRENYAA